MWIKKNGEVYFPDAYADAVGSTRRDLYIDNTGKIGYISSSQLNKENIEVMKDIDWLYKLNPVSFTYRSDNSGRPQYGLIAEEVEKVNSLFVSYDEEGQAATVSYSELVTPLLKALQNQQRLIQDLQQRIEILEGKKPSPR